MVGDVVEPMKNKRVKQFDRILWCVLKHLFRLCLGDIFPICVRFSVEVCIKSTIYILMRHLSILVIYLTCDWYCRSTENLWTLNIFKKPPWQIEHAQYLLGWGLISAHLTIRPVYALLGFWVVIYQIDREQMTFNRHYKLLNQSPLQIILIVMKAKRTVFQFEWLKKTW